MKNGGGVFERVAPVTDFPAAEARVRAFWRERDVFARSLALRSSANQRLHFLTGRIGPRDVPDTSDAVEVSHVSLNDGTVEGLEGDDVVTLQFHPEASPGPHDALPFFDRIAEKCRSAPIFAAS